MARSPQGRRSKGPGQSEPIDNTDNRPDHPVFAQPQPTADPKEFGVPHPSDEAAYKRDRRTQPRAQARAAAVPAAARPARAAADAGAVFGDNARRCSGSIAAHGQIVFHAVGDTGNTRGPETQNLVADKMVSDFDDEAAENAAAASSFTSAT